MYRNHITALDGIKAVNLRDHIEYTQELGRKLQCGDWAAAIELCEMHMYFAAMIGKRVSVQYNQDLEEMVSWAFLGLVEACRRIYVGEKTIKNVTGYLIMTARSHCINQRRCPVTGESQYDMHQRAVNGWPTPKRVPMVDGSAESEELATIDFVDDYLTMLNDDEMSIFNYLLRGYDDTSTMSELGLPRATYYRIKPGIERKFDKWLVNQKK